MRIAAMFQLNLEESNPEAAQAKDAIREHTELVMMVRRDYVLRQIKTPDDLKDQYKKSKEHLGILIAKCLIDNSFLLLDVRYDTDDVLTKEEQAILLAPEG